MAVGLVLSCEAVATNRPTREADLGRAAASLLILAWMSSAALAQRPPQPGQGPPQFSFERAWDWLMARPGVMVALAVILAAIIYMVATRKKSGN